MKTNYFVLLLVLTLFSGTLAAQQGMNKGCGMQGNCCPGIPDLTENQKTEMQKLKTAHMKEVMPIRNQLNELEAHLKTLTTATNPDLNAIYAEIEKIGKVKTDLQKMKAKHHQDIRKLLTDEQRLMFDMHSGKGCGQKDKGCGQQGQGCGEHGQGCGQHGQGMEQGMHRWGNPMNNQ